MNNLYPWQLNDYDYLLRLKAKLPQAIILHGASGIGINDLARSWVYNLHCPHSNLNDYYCGSCNSCLLLTDGAHPDFYVLTPEEEEKTIAVACVRKMIDFLTLSTHMSAYKIVFIEDTALLTLNSANMLLKILEEPPSYALFVLITYNIHGVLPTIVSRCHKYKVSSPDPVIARDYLRAQQISDYEFWLKFYNYSPLFETLIDNHQLQRILQVLAIPNADKIYELTSEFDGKTIAYSFILEFIGKWLSDLISYKLSNELIYFEGYINLIEPLINKLNIDKAFFMQDRLSFLMAWVHHPLNYKLQIENLLFNYQQIFVK
ncbi:MAG: hypothetical protein KBD37_03365 [Burkholderiales bacterium]|nr:hypothetical protein [Burkholderiales bacterium]